VKDKVPSSYVAENCQQLHDEPAYYSVKWTTANRRGIFMHCVAAATCLKR